MEGAGGGRGEGLERGTDGSLSRTKTASGLDSRLCTAFASWPARSSSTADSTGANAGAGVAEEPRPEMERNTVTQG